MLPRWMPQLAHLILVISIVAGTTHSPAQAQQAGDQASSQPQVFDVGIGGCGGVYFLAAPGELTVDLYKRDRNLRGGTTELRAILAGPDRQVLREISIPDDGQPRGSGLGPVQQVRLSTHVKHPGVYALNITVSQDRYGDNLVWGFRTNCPKYLIETSRGHRDQRREEPIVLLNPGRPGSVCFVPRRGAFRMDISGLPRDVKQLPVFDANGQLVQTLEADDKGQASHSFAADAGRGTEPWRLELASQQATIHIDGVTRWTTGDRFENLPYWSPDRDSFFPFLEYRWLLTPYRQLVYGQPGEQRTLEFQVHNNAQHNATIQLDIESDGATLPAHLSATSLDVPPQQSAPVTLTCTVPAAGKEQVYRVRATPANRPDFSTYASLTVKSGVAPATKPISIPLILRPYEHENQQFGYLPDYPVESQMYFDLGNRPFVRTGGGIATRDADHWRTITLREAVKDTKWRDRPISIISTKIAFDADNDLYLLGKAGRQAVLLHSTDHGETFSVHPIPGREGQPGTFDFEQFSGHNVPQGPPPITRFTRTASDPKLIWRRINDLELILPEKVNGRITMGDPILISRMCIGLSSHSGIPSSVVSRDDKVHVAWGEATDPNKSVPGVPTYVVTYDRATRTLGKPALVGYGPPANDVHNSPSITIDSQGYLHAITGTHGQPFPYSRSLKPNDAGSGWTEPELVGTGRQTYLGLVCGDDDTLHLVFRMWRSNVEPHPKSIHATLAYQRKRPGENWEEPRVLIVSPFSEYSVFYHRLTIDHLGRLFLSYDYWSTYWFYRTDHWGDRRALLMSPEGGDTWKLVDTQDLDRIKRQ